MIRRAAALAAVIVLGLGAAANAQTADVRALAPGAAPAQASLGVLNGIIGSWKTELGAASWTPPVGGEIVGHVALTDDKGAPRVHELWIFKPEGGSIVLLQKIINGDLTEREDKDKFEVRKLVAVRGGSLYFDNLTMKPEGDAMILSVNRAVGGLIVVHYKRIK